MSALSTKTLILVLQFLFTLLEMEEAKRASEAAMGAATPTGSTASSSGSGTTPDYAVGLTALNPGTPAPLPIYTPTPSASVVNTTITTARK